MKRAVLVVVLACLVWLAGFTAGQAAPLKPPTHRTWVRAGTKWPYDRASWYSATSNGYYWRPDVVCERYGWSTRVMCR